MRATRLTRTLATVVAVWFVVGGLLGSRHEAVVGHHVDARTGAAVHAPGVVGHHTGDRSDIHRSRTAAEGESDCAIVAALHAAASADVAGPALTLALADPARAPSIASAVARAPAEILRFAPKTSPPPPRAI